MIKGNKFLCLVRCTLQKCCAVLMNFFNFQHKIILMMKLLIKIIKIIIKLMMTSFVINNNKNNNSK